MIVPNNGYIEVEQITEAKDGYGFPTDDTAVSYGKKIPCHILKNTEDKRGDYKDGKFIRYAFTVWFEMQDFKAEKVRLTDNRGNVKGVFEVQNIEFCDLTGRVKIDL